MKKESLERLTDEQIESISGAGEYSLRDAWLLEACPFCGYINKDIKKWRFTKENLYDDLVCPQCKKVYNIEDCVEEYKKYNNEQHW